MIILVDDGTLDTVLECDVCGERMRFTFAAAGDSLSYSEFVDWAMDNARFGHHCTAEVNGVKGCAIDRAGGIVNAQA